MIGVGVFVACGGLFFAVVAFTPLMMLPPAGKRVCFLCKHGIAVHDPRYYTKVPSGRCRCVLWCAGPGGARKAE